jgi:hypothetical protein
MFDYKNISVEYDVLLSKVGIVVSIVLGIVTFIYLDNPSYLLVFGTALIAFVFYLSQAQVNFKLNINNNKFPSLSYDILFALVYTLCIVALYMRQDIYIRPLEFIILISLMNAITAAEILFSANPKPRKILIKIMLFGVIWLLSSLSIYPTVIGVDPFLHNLIVDEITAEGHILPFTSSYSELPIFHIIISVFSTLTDFSYKWSSAFAIGIMQVIINSLIIFLIGRRMFNTRVGLLAALILICSNYHLLWGFWIIPNTIAAVFVLLTLYVVLFMYENHSASLILFLLLSVTLILTHTVTSLWLAILMLSSYVISAIYIWVEQPKERKMGITSIFIPFTFIAIMLAWWTYVSGHTSQLGTYLKWGFELDSFVYTFDPIMSEQIPIISVLEQSLSLSGYLMLFMFSLIGSLFMISKRGNCSSFHFGVLGLVTLSITFFGKFLGKYILWDRWSYFSQILLAVAASIAIIHAVYSIRNENVRTFFGLIITFMLTVCMISSPVANIDNPILGPHMKIRYAFLESEVAALDTVQSLSNGAIGVDSYYGLTNMNNMNEGSLIRIDDSLLKKDFSNLRGGEIVLIREEVASRQFNSFRSMCHLNYDPRRLLIDQGFLKLYDSRSVSGYTV